MLVAMLRMPRSLPAAALLGRTSVIKAMSSDMYVPNPMPLTSAYAYIAGRVGLTSGMAMDRASRTDAPITKILRRPVRSEIFAAGIAAARVPTRASTDISCRALSTAPPSRPT